MEIRIRQLNISNHDVATTARENDRRKIPIGFDIRASTIISFDIKFRIKTAIPMFFMICYAGSDRR
jgi:hypothetical protein